MRRNAICDAASPELAGGTLLKDLIMKLVPALLAAAAVSCSAAALAAPVPQSIAVEAGDLDLGSPEGQRILALRIGRAARMLCDAGAVDSLPRNIRSERGCVREARASVEAAVKILTAASEPASAKGG